MNDFKRRFYFYLAKTDLPFNLIFLFLNGFVFFFFSCLTLNMDRLSGLSYEDEAILNMLSFQGIEKQSYVFIFISLCALIIFLYVLFSMFEIDGYLGNVFLLKSKGYDHIKKDLGRYHLLETTITLSLSLILYVILYTIMNAVFPTSIPIFVFNPLVLIPFAVFDLISCLIYHAVLKKKTSHAKMLAYLREKY